MTDIDKSIVPDGLKHVYNDFMSFIDKPPKYYTYPYYKEFNFKLEKLFNNIQKGIVLSKEDMYKIEYCIYCMYIFKIFSKDIQKQFEKNMINYFQNNNNFSLPFIISLFSISFDGKIELMKKIASEYKIIDINFFDTLLLEPKYSYDAIEQIDMGFDVFINTHKFEIKLTHQDRTAVINMLKGRYQNVKNIMKFILDDQTLILDNSTIKNIITEYDIVLLKDCILRSNLLTTELFEHVCKTINDRSIDFIKFFFNHKIEPTRQAFRNILDFVKNNKSQYNYHEEERKKEIINTFIEFGFALTYEDLLEMITYNLILETENIKKFNFKFDNRYYDACSQLKASTYITRHELPYIKEIKDIQPTMKYVEEQCGIYYSGISDIIKTFNITPTQKCLQNACLSRDTRLIYFLISKGCVIDVECMKNFISHQKTTLKGLFDNFLENNDITPKQKKQEDIIVEDKKEIIKDEKPKEPKIIQSKIPDDFSYTECIYNKIPVQIRKLLNITDKNINYLFFRKKVLEYVKNNNMMTSDSNEITDLVEPLLFNGSTTVSFDELNEWMYSLLSSEIIVVKKVHVPIKIIKDKTIEPKIEKTIKLKNNKEPNEDNDVDKDTLERRNRRQKSKVLIQKNC